VAADQAEADTRIRRTGYVPESEVKSLLWLCGSLLPEDLDLAHSTDPWPAGAGAASRG